jgi:hypothetical protein
MVTQLVRSIIVTSATLFVLAGCGTDTPAAPPPTPTSITLSEAAGSFNALGATASVANNQPGRQFRRLGISR